MAITPVKQESSSSPTPQLSTSSPMKILPLSLSHGTPCDHTVPRFSMRQMAGVTVLMFLVASWTGLKADTTTFTGTGVNPDWSTPENWTTVPISGDNIVIDDTTGQNSLALDAPQTIGTLTFGNTGVRTTPFVISGTNALTLTGGLTADGSFSSLGLTVNAPVSIGSAQTWSVGGEAGTPTQERGVKLANPTAGVPLNVSLGGKLTKTGSGQLGFSGLTIGNGDIQVSEGSLKLSAANATKLTLGGSGTLTVNNGATLILSQGTSPATSTFDISKAIRLENGATVQMGGSQAFHSTNSKISSTITLATSSTTTLNALNYSGTNGSNFIFSGLWLGGSTDSVLEKTGSSTLTFSNTSATAQTLAKLKVSEGTLILNSNTSNGWRGNVEIATGAFLKNQLADQLNNGSAVTVNGTWDLNSARDIIDSVSGGGNIINSGNAGATTGLALNLLTSSTFSGTLTGTYLATTGGFSGTQTLTGNLSVNRLVVQSANDTSGGITLAGNASATVAGVELGNAALSTIDGTLLVTDNATLTVGVSGVTQGLGEGVLALGGGEGTATLAASATQSSSGNINLINNTEGSPVIDTQGFTVTLAGTVGGTGGFVKSGTGRLIMSGDNSYSGGTTLSAGELRAGSDTAFGTGTITTAGTVILNLNGHAVNNAIAYAGGTVTNSGSYAGTLTVAAGSTFQNAGVFGGQIVATGNSILMGTGTVSGFTTLQSGATLAPGNSPGTLEFANGLTLEGGSILDFFLGTGGNSLIEVSGGTLSSSGLGQITLNITASGTFGAGTYTLFDVSGINAIADPNSLFTVGTAPGDLSYSFLLDGNNISLNVVPEPGQLALFACGAAFFVLTGRRFRRNSPRR